jgi:hypothetical protein
MTEVHSQNIEFTGALSRPSTTKGSIHAHDGIINFQMVSPTTSDQILVSNSGATAGVEWSTGNAGIGFGITARNKITLPAPGGSVYFLNATGPTNIPCCVVLPGCDWLEFTITPARLGASGADGWTTNPAGITGGSFDIYYCYVDANTNPSVANLKYYATGNTTPPVTPDFQIMGTGINSTGTNFTSYMDTFSYTVTSGQQVTVRLTNNITFGVNPTFHAFQCLSMFRTM